MKHLLFTFIISIVMTTSVQAQHLTARQLHLGTISALAAQGDMARLQPALKNGLDAGLTINELKEALSHIYAYVGFPRSLNALGVLRQVIETNHNEVWQEGKPWMRPSAWDNASEVYALGVKNQSQMAGQAFTYNFCPQIDYYLKSHLFGGIFAGDELSAADRELVTVSALSAIKGAESQLSSHKAGAVRMGNTIAQVEELCHYLSANGLSNSDSAADAVAGVWPKGDPNVSYAKFFVGDSHLASLNPKNLSNSETTILPMNNVTFEPGCRNNWHIHHGARQILICVSGKGWYQEWGKQAIALEAGDIIDIPEGVKHWHGAQKDSWFQHIATHVEVENTQPGSAPNEWLEEVGDEEYNQLIID